MTAEKSIRIRKCIDALISVIAILLVSAALYFNTLHLIDEPGLLQFALVLFYLMYLWLFIIRRPSLEAVERPVHYLFVLAGTFTPLLVTLQPQTPAWLVGVSIPLEVSGILLTLAALACLGRSFGIVAAKRQIKTHGLYRYIRHPLYAGELSWFLSIVLQNVSIYNAILFGVGLLAQMQRMREEEGLLKSDPLYEEYLEQVKYRLIPGMY